MSIKLLWLLEATDQSGITFAAKQLVPALLKYGIELHIFSLKSGESQQDFEHLDCPVQIFPHFGNIIRGRSVAKEAKKHKIEIVHAQSAALTKKAKSLANKLSCPYIVTANRLAESEYNHLQGFTGNGIIAVSDAIKERLTNIVNIPQNLITVIHNGLDLNNFPAIEYKKKIKLSTVPVIGTLGQFIEHKGQGFFLLAAKKLIESGIDAEFVLLGDGPDKSLLRQLSEELGISKRITFTPHTITTQISQLDILVEPSIKEGLGLSVMQAMATGVAVVANAVGGIYSLIEDGKTGLMVKAGDPDALANAVKYILKHPEERIDMIRHAREKIEANFSSEVITKKLINYYKNLL